MAARGLKVLRGGGDDATRSFERHYRESYQLVYNYVLRRMASREATEDVVADAFLNAARAYDRFDPSRAKFSTWVISIAHNCMRDWWAHHPAIEPIGAVPERVYVSSDGSVERLGDVDLAERLLRVLDDEERRLVFLKYYEERRNVEIAEELGMNASTVSTKLARAMAKMRTAIDL